MKKFIFVFIIIAALSSSLFAFPESDERDSSLTPYKPSYLIFGSSDDQVRGQISLKYHVFEKYGTNLYAGYTQVMFWDLYRNSSPFKDINFNPEVFWNIPIEKSIFQYIRLGFYEHKSNGKDGAASRSWDRGYGQIVFNVSPFDSVPLEILLRYNYYYNIANDNPDIYKYDGSFHAGVSIRYEGGKYISKEELYANIITGGKNTRPDFKNGSQEIGLRFRLFTPIFVPHFYIQYFHGYAESLLDYKDKETRLRVGLILM